MESPAARDHSRPAVDTISYLKAPKPPVDGDPTPEHVDSSGLRAQIEQQAQALTEQRQQVAVCLLYTSPSPRDRQKSRMPSSA